MAFVKKTWKDRIAEFPTRRRLTKSNGDSELVTVSREEGTLSQEGDAFSAENMNDLERRVDDAISEINSNLIELGERGSATKYDTADMVYLNTYTDATHVYTFQADGYVTIASTSGGSGQAVIVSSNDVAIVSFDNICSQNYWSSNTLYVKKGMKCYCTAKSGAFGTNVNVSFRPLKL